MAGKSLYGTAGQEVFDLFQDYLEGESDRLVLVASSAMLEEPPRQAIEKSLDALGFGDDCCTFAVLTDALDAQAIFLMVEGLDPLYVIGADEDAVRRLGDAYRTDFRLDAAERLFGRSAVMFGDLAALIEGEKGKRKAWELFKTLG